jgi:hypothetical protein
MHVHNKFPPHIHNVISINNSEYFLPVASRVMGANKIIFIYHSVFNHVNCNPEFLLFCTTNRKQKAKRFNEDFSTAAAERDRFAMLLSKKV